jgi:two-component system sensor histidine kinase DegS
MTLETLGALATARPQLRSQIEALQELAKQLDQDVAFRVWELRPAALESLGLAAALTEYAGNWARRFGIHAELRVARSTGARATPEMETTLYRFAQEALNNVAKHARADRVDIVLDHAGDHVSLIVEDNGIGFDPSGLETLGQGFGLIGMRERAALAGAEFRIESARGQGTTLIFRMPAARPVVTTT